MKKISIINIFLIALMLLLFGAEKSYAFEQLESGASASLEINLISSEKQIELANRAKVLKNFLEKYNSPLADNASDFVYAADKYNLDWRLVASIAGLESTFGKHIPYNSYNGWGWGVYGDNVIRFSSWKEAIETISKGLRENYLKDKIESDPYFIGPTYAASPTWAERVSFFMEKMEEYRIENAKSTLALSL